MLVGLATGGYDVVTTKDGYLDVEVDSAWNTEAVLSVDGKEPLRFSISEYEIDHWRERQQGKSEEERLTMLREEYEFRLKSESYIQWR